MRLITIVGLTFLGGFVIGHGVGALIDLLPLFAMITLLYVGIGVYETLQARAAAQARPAAPVRRPARLTSRRLVARRHAA